MTEQHEPVEIEAEDRPCFQEYMYEDGTRVSAGTPIGKEIYENGEWVLKLYDNIRFSSLPWNDDDDEEDEKDSPEEEE